MLEPAAAPDEGPDPNKTQTNAEQRHGGRFRELCWRQPQAWPERSEVKITGWKHHQAGVRWATELRSTYEGHFGYGRKGPIKLYYGTIIEENLSQKVAARRQDQ